MSAAVSMASQPPTRRDMIRPSPSSSRSAVLANEAAHYHHSEVANSHVSSRPRSSSKAGSTSASAVATTPEIRQRKPSDSTSTSRTSRRKTHNRGSSSTSSKHQHAADTAAHPLPTKLHIKKHSSPPVALDTRAANSTDIPNATPPSPRMPYFTAYPNRILRTPDVSPYHSEDVDDTAGRPRFRGKLSSSSGAVSDGGGTSSPSFRSRSRMTARHAGDESDIEGPSPTAGPAYAWPAKIPSSKLNPHHLQVPSSSSSSKTRGDSSLTPSPMSSVSSSPSGTYTTESSPLSSVPPRHTSSHRHHTRLTDAIPTYGPYGRHKFPSIRDPPDFLSGRGGNVNGEGVDASLYVASGFEVSEMDALVASINGGEERGYSHVADLVHLSTSVWPPSKGLRKSASGGMSGGHSSSKTSSNVLSSSTSSSRLHPHSSQHHSKHSKHSSSRQAMADSSSPSASASTSPSPSPLQNSSKTLPPPPSTHSSSTVGARSSSSKYNRPTDVSREFASTRSEKSSPSTPTYQANYSPTSPPSLSRSSGVSSDLSTLSTLSTSRTDRSASVHDGASQHSYNSRSGAGISTKMIDTNVAGKTPVPSITDIIRAYAPEHLKQKPEGLLIPPRSPNPASTSPSSISSGSGLGRHMLKMPMSTPVADIAEESESRSSIDSIAEEALRNVRTAPTNLRMSNAPVQAGPSTPSSPSSLPMTPTARSSHKYTNYDTSTNPSELSYDSGGGISSTWTSVPSSPIPPRSNSPTHEMAQYLRSPRLTRLIKLRRVANAGLTVSLADVGSPTGRPALLFLGLGCVRYIIGLYDEMAEALGLRLICIDRWGLGRTSEVPDEKRGMLEWASVVEEVMDTLGVGRFSIFAHSAGAPYALASALKLSDRVHGSVHLLAPWVSQSVDGGYKWLKYMPASIIKTAQTAEWKMQAWKIGKPPTIPWEGIGFDPAKTIGPSGPPMTLASSFANFEHNQRPDSLEIPDDVSLPSIDSRPSFNSSEYDDLADFDGRFASSTTLATPNGGPVSSSDHPVKKKSSFLSFLEKRERRQPSVSTITRPSATRSDSTPPPSSSRAASASFTNGKEHAELRSSQSRTSLRSRPSIKSSKKNRSTPPVHLKGEAVLPPLNTAGDFGFNFPTVDDHDGDAEWHATLRTGSATVNGKAYPNASKQVPSTGIDRSNGRRSLSHSPMPRGAGVIREKLHLPPLPAFATGMEANGPPSPTLSQASHTLSISARSHGSTTSTPYPTFGTTFSAFNGMGGPGSSTSSPHGEHAGGSKKSKDAGQKHAISLASALMRASHAEALKGGTQDLLAILERPGSRPWGFSYTDVRKHVKVWYGDKDERIGVSSVRWMEKTMRDCEVKIIKGEGHGLLTNADVVVEVLESIAAEWKKN